MGAEDVRRQQLNVFRMQLLGAEVVPVESGTRTLKDALNEALRDWVTRVEDTYYCLGSVTGPHPYPTLVKEFQAVVGREVKAQLGGVTPAALVACVGGGCNAMGLFAPFVDDARVRLVGVEAAGAGLLSGAHSASLCAGEPGILHGAKTLVLQTAGGQIAEAHSLAPGLDYPGVGPEHAFLRTSGRAEYVAVTDDDAVAALQQLARSEGILCALESAHAVAQGIRVARELGRDEVVVINLSGRGDKDTPALAERLAKEKKFTAENAEKKQKELKKVEGKDQRKEFSLLLSASSVPSAVNPAFGSRLTAMFDRLRTKGQKALGVYMTVGDPDLETSEQALRAALAAGADFAELGVPFSDPSADGPSIQRAMEHALKAGTDMASVLALAARLRTDFPDKPLVLFGYANPFFRALQHADFLPAASAADGVLIVDVPPEHGHDFAELAARLDWIRLLAPNATPERRAIVAKAAHGFIYLVAVTGVTDLRGLRGAR
jgi:tryptophan synthase alpha subunit/cysteine synthase